MLEEMLANAARNSRGRRLFTSDQKAVIVSEWGKSGLSGPEFGRRYGILCGMLFRWRNNTIQGARMGIQNEGDLYSRAALEALRRENEELKKSLGKRESGHSVVWMVERMAVLPQTRVSGGAKKSPMWPPGTGGGYSANLWKSANIWDSMGSAHCGTGLWPMHEFPSGPERALLKS